MIMPRTSSLFSMRAAPSVSAQAHDWGQPQFRSTPLQCDATSVDALASSRGTLAPNWTMVGGCFPRVEMVKSAGQREQRKKAGEGKKPQTHRKSSRLTTISGKPVSIELLGQNHGRPAEIGPILVDGLTEG